MDTRTICIEAEEILKHYESLHDGDLSVVGLQPKQCPTGYWTEGYGHVIIDPVNLRPLKGKAMKARAYECAKVKDEAQAIEVLNRDLILYNSGVKALVKVPYNDYQRSGLVSFAYNIGLSKFQTSSALKLINQGNWQAGADAMLRWNKGDTNGDGVLEVLPGLTYRRQSERELILNGKVKFFN